MSLHILNKITSLIEFKYKYINTLIKLLICSMMIVFCILNLYIYILYKLYYIKYNDILIYVYINYNNIVLNRINIIWKIKFNKIIKKIIIKTYNV